MRSPLAVVLALTGASCAPTGRHLHVDVRLLETPGGAAPRERAAGRLLLNVAIVRNARLAHARTAEILKAAETPQGGSPQRLMRASRSLAAGPGVVFLGTARIQDPTEVGQLDVFQLALSCESADIDLPGDLNGCAGYFLRVPRTWPAEVYEVPRATVSLLPEGGTARGRVRARSAPAGFAAEVDGEFTATLIEFGG